MSEYIEREAAKKVLAFGVGVTAANALDNVPAADVAPVVHGEWLPCEPGRDVRFFCNICETEISTSWDYDADEMWKYCPNCGARMDGE